MAEFLPGGLIYEIILMEPPRPTPSLRSTLSTPSSTSRRSRSRVTATPAVHRNVRIRWTDKMEEAVLEALLRPFGKDIAQIALTKLSAGKSPLIVRLLSPSSLLLLSKLRASTITIRRTRSYRRSSTASLARGGIKIKAWLLLVRKL